MATTVVTRPAQALRNRRDGPRPASISKRQNAMEAATEQSNKRRKLNEPFVRDSQYILDKFYGKQPSLTIHLYDATFRFEGQDVSWTYDSPMKCVLRHLKHQTVPHEMMEELLSGAIQWYDGCLIVEVHNHRAKAGKEKGRKDLTANDGNLKFGMHNYTQHVTPSPMVAYPSKAITDQALELESADSHGGNMAAPERPRDKDGPSVVTVVMHPTPLSQHAEMMILMKTPADQMRSNKKRGADGASTAAPPTPQMFAPPTPLTQTSRGPVTQSQKMCLEDGDLYSFQADLLVATEPPLYLEPVDNPQDAERVLDMLQHPLHQAQPPSSKTRKRTTAEVAADDAQAAESERRLLIMDERLKPTTAGAVANENQNAAASLGFSRFKTIEMVRQKHEEADRAKKEEEARLALEKRQAEEQNAIQQKNEQLAQRQRQLQILAAQQAAQQQQPNQANIALMRQEQFRQQQAARAQQQALMNHAHGHPQQNGMMPNGQQGFQQGNQGAATQSSPVVRNQTPMIHSSPMTAQGGFPMAQTSSQGGGSPQRPTSGAMANPMIRQASQQHQGSRNNTPQMPQGTPAMAQAMPRQMSQTPRMQPGSPGSVMQQGTPNMPMGMQTPQMGNQSQLTPEQMQILRAQQHAMQQGQANGASQVAQFNPEQLSLLKNITQQHSAMNLQLSNAMNAARQAGNQQAAQTYYNRIQQNSAQLKAKQAQVIASFQQQQQQQHQMNAANQMGNAGGGQAGSPGGMQQPTPQMGHAHPQQAGGDPNQMSPMQFASAQAKAQQLAAMRQSAQLSHAQQQLQGLAQQYSGLNNVPPQIIQSLPPAAQQLLKQQMLRQQNARQQQAFRAQAAQQQQQQNGGGNATAAGGNHEQVPGSQPNPQYMQQLRQNQAMLAQMQSQQAQQQLRQQQQQQGGGGGMGFNMPNGGSFGAGTPDGSGDGGGGAGGLGPQFAAMANAVNRGNSGGQQGQGQ